MVSGLAAFAYSCFVGANRSTNGTPLAAHTSRMAAVYSARLALLAEPSGRFGLFRSSWAMGEKNTSRGADWPSYFWPSMPSITWARSLRKPATPPGPRRASL